MSKAIDNANKYRKKPIVIEAIKWTGENELEIVHFLGESIIDVKSRVIRIETLEGVMSAKVGDYIIRGVKGECYPCKPDIFEQTYEPVDEHSDTDTIGELDSYTRMMHERNKRLNKELEELQDVRDDLIAGLLVYAEEYIGSDDNGDHAKSVLKDVGVVWNE